MEQGLGAARSWGLIPNPEPSSVHHVPLTDLCSTGPTLQITHHKNSQTHKNNTEKNSHTNYNYTHNHNIISMVGITTMNELVDPVDPQIAVSPQEKGTLELSMVGPDGKKQ